MDEGTLTIDGVGPMPVEPPATVAELCDVVRRCAADGTAIYPVGGGTLLDYGTPPDRPGIALSTAALNQVIDFPARDMTITVQAGITMARLHEITKAERLWLPIDVPAPETATLGGSIAANVSGPRRYGYGTFRDYVIGVTLVNDRGEETKAGGRVVKNVAGYDLMKLYTGSLGTLGVITQVTLKLKPVPERQVVVWAECGIDQLAPILTAVHTSQTRPVSVDAQSATSSKTWVCSFALEGSYDAVEWQGERLISELMSSTSVNPQVDGDFEAAAILDNLTASCDGRVVLLAATLPSGVAELCRASMSCGVVKARAGSGVVEVGSGTDSPSAARQVVDSLSGVVSDYRGALTIRRCPSEWKRTLPVWGRPPADLALQKAVKRALDPKGIFNPGRFVTDAF